MFAHILHHLWYNFLAGLLWWVGALILYIVIPLICSLIAALMQLFRKPDEPTYTQAVAAQPQAIGRARQEYLDMCERLKQQDAEGSPTAAYRLYALIRNKEPRSEEWLRYLKRAAYELDNYEAQFKLASGYENGSIKDASITREAIVELYEKSAAQGYRKAANRLRAMGMACAGQG